MPLFSKKNAVRFSARDRRLTLCSILLEQLRQETGADWHLARLLFGDLPPCHFDTLIEARADGSPGSIVIQLLDATLEWKVWNTLSQKRLIRKYFWVDAVSDSVRRRVANTFYGLPDQMPACTLLAFDAAPLDDRALPRIMRSFKKRHGSWARRIGFRGIWLVGSARDHSCRLDSA